MGPKLQSKSKDFIVKSNALVEARYRLGLQESQIILWLLTQIQPDDEDFKTHRLEIAEFAQLTQVKIDGKYSELRKITKRLMQRVLEIYEPQQSRFIQVSWLSSAIYETKKGHVSLEFSPNLKPYLLQLKSHFTKIDIADSFKLRSVHAIRVFELLLQYIHLGNREITVEDLRTYCGIQEQKYKDYFDLKCKVINKAKTEINTKTDYEVDYEEIKESRKIVSLKWTIKKKVLLQKDIKKSSAFQKELRLKSNLMNTLSEYGFSKAMAKRFLQDYEEEVIQNAIKAVNLQVERGKARNPKAMLRIAIEEKWDPEIFKTK